MGVATVSKQPAIPSERDDSRWELAVEEHRAALARLLVAAEGVDEEAWRAPWRHGGWTRAQITEHLALGYEAILAELAGGPPMRARGSKWQQTLLRWVVLPHILFHRSFPVRAAAPRETRPPEVSMGRAQLLRRLRDLGERFEREMEVARRAGRGWLTHPYFGRVGAVKAMRFVAVHIEHHTRQVAAAT